MDGPQLDAADPAILLISGMGASMDWWEEEFCQRLAAGGRFVIRYDHRDTGQSVSYPAGAPGYTAAVLAADVTVRALVARIVDRTSDMAASMTNHALAEEGDLARGRLDEIADGGGCRPGRSARRPGGSVGSP